MRYRVADPEFAPRMIHHNSGKVPYAIASCVRIGSPDHVKAVARYIEDEHNIYVRNYDNRDDAYPPPIMKRCRELYLHWPWRATSVAHSVRIHEVIVLISARHSTISSQIQCDDGHEQRLFSRLPDIADPKFWQSLDDEIMKIEEYFHDAVKQWYGLSISSAT